MVIRSFGECRLPNAYHEAAKRSGMLYSLLGTCKMHNIEPYTWFKEVLQIIPQHPVNKVKELLPHRYKK
jgi:transposase